AVGAGRARELCEEQGAAEIGEEGEQRARPRLQGRAPDRRGREGEGESVTPRGNSVNVASPISRCAPWAASQTPVPICPASSQEADPSSGAAAVAMYTAIEGMTTRSHVPSTPSAPARTPRNQLSGRVKPRSSRARGS